MKLKYFHLTDSKNLRKILKEGIKADEEGNIFVFTDMIVADEIAKHQVFTNLYSVFQIDRQGITGKISKDYVAEFARFYHRIIKQTQIEPQFLHFVTTERKVIDRPTAWDYLVAERLYQWTREQTDLDFAWRVEHRLKVNCSKKELSEWNKEYQKFMQEYGFIQMHKQRRDLTWE